MAEDDPPVPVLIGGVDEALGLCCSGSQRLESAEVREWHKSLTWRGHSLRRKRASLTAEVRFSSKRLGPSSRAAHPGRDQSRGPFHQKEVQGWWASTPRQTSQVVEGGDLAVMEPPRHHPSSLAQQGSPHRVACVTHGVGGAARPHGCVAALAGPA